MIITLFKGIIIGMIISAPLGPVGMLCLRETFNGGRREGILTGVGAMVSDVFYSFIVYLGVGMVLDFIISYDVALRISGGVIIIAFAYWIWHNAKRQIKHEPTRRLSKMHGIRKVTTAFLVTLTNPFIILLILPLFTRFQFVRETSAPLLEFGVAMLGIAIGCMLWWMLLTWAVKRLQAKTGDRGIRLISRSVALILGVIGAIGIYTGVDTLYTGESHNGRIMEMRTPHRRTDQLPH